MLSREACRTTRLKRSKNASREPQDDCCKMDSQHRIEHTSGRYPRRRLQALLPIQTIHGTAQVIVAWQVYVSPPFFSE